MNYRGICALLSVSYVGSVYIMPGGRSNRRDDLPVMIRRLAGVILMTACSTYSWGFGYQDWLLNFHPHVIIQTLKAVGLALLIYLPTILAYGFPTLKFKTWQQKTQVIRDLVVGPVSEEIVYRGIIASIYRDNLAPPNTIVKENFWYFAIAHFHHAIMNWLGEVISLRGAFAQAAAQFVMTGLFGTYACHLLLKSGTVWPCIVTHIICNYFGPPRLNGPSWYRPLQVAGFAAWVYCLRYF